MQPELKRNRKSVASNYDQQSAIGGRFRIISLPVGAATDHEGAFADLRDQILQILDDVMGAGVKSYLVAEMKMRKLLELNKTTETTFPSTAATMLISTDKAAVIENQIAG
jgi:hypothetical protein